MKSHGAEWWRGSDTAPSKRFWICYKVAECYFNVWADWFSHIQLLQVTPGTTSEAVHETVTIVSLEKLEIAFLSLFITVKQFSFCVLEHILTVKTGELCKSGVLCQQRQQQHCPQEMKCLKATILHSVTFVSGVGLSECWQRYRNAGIMLLVLLVLLFLPLASRVGLVVILIGFFPENDATLDSLWFDFGHQKTDVTLDLIEYYNPKPHQKHYTMPERHPPLRRISLPGWTDM